MLRTSVLALAGASLVSGFTAPGGMSLRPIASPSMSGLSLRRSNTAGVSFLRMGTLLDNGELQLTDEECEKLKMPPNTVVPVENVEQFQNMLQEIDDEAIRRLARQIGTNPEEEPYEGYMDDIRRLGLEGKDLTASSSNPGGMYGPDGKAYAPWMVGKVQEDYRKKEQKFMTEDEKKFSFDSRGQELSGVGLTAALLGDEVRLEWTVEGEENSKGYIVSRRPGGTEDEAFTIVADYQTPGADLAAGKLAGKYSYVDGSVAPGVWVYRVQEEDLDGSKAALTQTIIDVPSTTDKIKTYVAMGVLATILSGMTYVSVALDPQNGIGTPQ